MAIGFVVVKIGQTSRLPEAVCPATVHATADYAERLAQESRAITASIGRRDEYVVCELVPVDRED